MGIINIIAILLVIIGGIAWGIFGLTSFNIVEFICMKSKTFTRIIYILVGIAAVWLIISWIVDGAILFVM